MIYAPILRGLARNDRGLLTKSIHLLQAAELHRGRARFCLWRGRSFQSASGFEFGVHAIFKARPDLYLACALFSWRVSRRLFQSLKTIYSPQRVGFIERSLRLHRYRLDVSHICMGFMQDHPFHSRAFSRIDISIDANFADSSYNRSSDNWQNRMNKYPSLSTYSNGASIQGPADSKALRSIKVHSLRQREYPVHMCLATGFWRVQCLTVAPKVLRFDGVYFDKSVTLEQLQVLFHATNVGQYRPLQPPCLPSLSGVDSDRVAEKVAETWLELLDSSGLFKRVKSRRDFRQYWSAVVG